ncbi:putative tail protein gpE P2 bacteriophage [Yersinia pseudotuberculosis str. PA3606]|nr:putative tail protein gpE P2 bacteriophage [Yersinia pseudotuberculosis str. PA3606]
MKKITDTPAQAIEINENIVVLETPIKRGETLITEISKSFAPMPVPCAGCVLLMWPTLMWMR